MKTDYPDQKHGGGGMKAKPAMGKKPSKGKPPMMKAKGKPKGY